MFGMLGQIAFEVLTSPANIQSAHVWHYAEHQVIEDIPRLQWIADGLELIHLTVRFHVSFTDPAAQIAQLIAAGKDHTARALVFGNGVHRGYFVVTALQTVSTQMTAAGDLIATTVDLTLKEWALAIEIDPNAPPLPQFIPLGIVPAPAGAGTSVLPYQAAAGVEPNVAFASTLYAAAPLAAPGVSAILNIPLPTGPATAQLLASDIQPSTIVRAA